MKATADPVQPFKAGEKLSLILLTTLLLLLIYVGRTQLVRSQLLFWGISGAVSLGVGLLAVLFFRLRQQFEEKVKELARKEMELTIAQEVQQELFPRKRPHPAQLELAAVCLPARGISGDYYDFLEISDGQWGVAVADISGKGISAALISANVQAMVRSQCGLHKTMGDLFTAMNGLLVQSTAPSRYATLFYGVYRFNERTFHYVNAGHVHPVLIQQDGIVRLSQGGVPLGLLAQVEYCEGSLRLEPGDLLAIFSDGLLEAVDGSGEEFGDDRLVRMLFENRRLPLAALQSEILEQITGWSQKDVPDDDMTMVLIRVPVESAIEAKL